MSASVFIVAKPLYVKLFNLAKQQKPCSCFLYEKYECDELFNVSRTIDQFIANLNKKWSPDNIASSFVVLANYKIFVVLIETMLELVKVMSMYLFMIHNLYSLLELVESSQFSIVG